MLGERQKAWLKDRLAASDATWKVLANQIMLMALDLPLGNPINPDQWDGYAAERAELMQFVADNDIANAPRSPATSTPSSQAWSPPPAASAGGRRRPSSSGARSPRWACPRRWASRRATGRATPRCSPSAWRPRTPTSSPTTTPSAATACSSAARTSCCAPSAGPPPPWSSSPPS